MGGNARYPSTITRTTGKTSIPSEHTANVYLSYSTLKILSLTRVNRESLSEIRTATRRNQHLLKKLVQSSRIVEQKQPESSKRKSQWTQGIELAGSSTCEVISDINSNYGEDDMSEPSAKRRSLSPEEEDVSRNANGAGATPSRTRSGKVYHPTMTFAPSEQPSDRSIGVSSRQERVESPPLSTFPRSRRKQPSSRLARPGSRDDGHGKQSRGYYGLGRSLSPSSSVLGSPISQPDSLLASKHHPSPRSPRHEMGDLQTPPDSPISERKQQPVPPQPRQRRSERKDVQVNTATAEPSHRVIIPEDMLIKCPCGSDHECKVNDMCLDEPSMPKTTPRVSLILDPPEYKNYCSPRVDSDSEEDLANPLIPPFFFELDKRILDDCSPLFDISGESQVPDSGVNYIPRMFSPRYTSRGYYATSAYNSHRAARPGASQTTFPRTWGEGVYSQSAEDTSRKEELASQGSQSFPPDVFPGSTVNCDPISSTPSSNRSPAQANSTPTNLRPTTSKKPAPRRTATEEDARRHQVPPGYSLKNWDPTEEPILLLGSVFDFNSLGKWIYDWTIYHQGPSTPIADMAGELWLLLVQLSGKIKRAEETMPQIRRKENREMVDDFIESGERVTSKLKKLLKACESPMLKAASKVDMPGRLGKNAGTQFVDCLFGRSSQLDSTEKFMSSVRLWNLRFDANCEDILRNPGQHQ